MKKIAIKVLKFTGIGLACLIFALFVFVMVYSKMGTSTITAEIKGLGTKLLFVEYNNGFKVAFSHKDKIRIKISPKKTSMVVMKPFVKTLQRKHFRSKTLSFYIEPNSEIIIKGQSGGISIHYEIVEGNKLSFQLNELRNYLLPYYEIESQLNYESWQLRKKDSHKSRLLDQKFDSMRFHVVAPLRTEWAKKHLHYELSPTLFLESHIPRDTVIKYFNLMPDNTKESEHGLFLGSVIAGWEKTRIGQPTPAFTQSTLSKGVFSTDSLLGKYAVIHFWGSWCAPCMSEIQKMRDFYALHNNKIEFVSIACNDNYNNWTSVIEKYDMNWIHIFNDPTKIDLSLLYGITGFPTKFILDKNGKIIERFNGTADEFYKRLKEIAES